MKQKIVYNGKPASINNKKDNAKTLYQKNLRAVALEQNAFMMDTDIYVDILWKQNSPADIDNIIKYTLDALKGICYTDDRAIVWLKIHKQQSNQEQLIITLKSKFILSKFLKKLIYKIIAKPLMNYVQSNFKDIIDDEKNNQKNAQIQPKPKANLKQNPAIKPKNSNNKTTQMQITKAQNQEDEIENLIKTTLKTDKDHIQIAYNLKQTELKIYIIISSSLSKKERKGIMNYSNIKLMELKKQLNLPKLSIHYGSIPLKSKSIKL